jgi:hypothetical protein
VKDAATLEKELDRAYKTLTPLRDGMPMQQGLSKVNMKPTLTSGAYGQVPPPAGVNAIAPQQYNVLPAERAPSFACADITLAAYQWYHGSLRRVTLLLLFFWLSIFAPMTCFYMYFVGTWQ